MMSRPSKTLQYIILRFVPTNHMYVYCRLAHLTGVFKNHPDLVMYIIGSDYIKLYLLDSFHMQRANKLSKLNQSIYTVKISQDVNENKIC